MIIDTLISARWIIPVEPDNTILENSAIAIRQGRIVELLDSKQALKKYTPDRSIHLSDHVLFPGLVNSHGHAAMTLMRGIADDLPLMNWLEEHIWPTEQKWVGADFVYEGTQLACAEMIRSGTTCFNDMYFFAEETARAAEHAGMRATVGLIVVDFPSAWGQDADEYLQKGIELHDQLRNNNLIKTAFAPHAPYTVSDEPLARIATYAEELDIPIHMHVHETHSEIEQAIQQHGNRPLQRLQQLGFLTPRLMAVHMTQLNQDEIELCAQSGIHVVHCPESNMKLASGFSPLQQLVDAGINVAIGTDGAASNNDLDMIGEMRSAALLAKAVAGDASAIPAHTALRMATLNGARALGRDDTIGSLEPGKAADIVAVKLNDIETEPVFCPVSQLVYSTTRDKVTDVWVAGNHLLKDRELTTLDRDEIIHNTRKWKNLIMQE